jgi:hypothetical protein
VSEPGPANDGDPIHRLKNHLCIVVGFCELLIAECPSDDPRRADLLEVHHAAQEALAVLPEVAQRVRDDVWRMNTDGARS